MIRSVNKLLDPVKRQIRNSIARGVLTLVNDAVALQQVQIQLMALPQPDGSIAAEIGSDIEVMGHYGLTSVPFPGAEAAYVSVGGVRAHGLVIAVDDRRYRLTGLAAGEVALYDDQGQVVHLTRTGILVQTPLQARIAAADIQVHASNSYSWDVAGYGERWTATGGATWEHQTWQQGATVTTVTLAINPPEGPGS